LRRAGHAAPIASVARPAHGVPFSPDTVPRRSEALIELRKLGIEL
jgi:hypothetical protein